MADLSIEQERPCSKCGETKPLTEFHKQKGGKYGRRAYCRSCGSANYYQPNKTTLIAKAVARRRKSPERDRKNARKRYAENREFRVKAAAEYRDANRERQREIQRRSDAKKRSTPRGRLDNAISANISASLAKDAKAGRKWQSLVGYSLDDLVKHLERQFMPGMTWQNYGSWHVDHHIPKSAFNYETPDHIDFHRAWALSNLKPLWAADNISKKDRLSAPFQPSLAI